MNPAPIVPVTALSETEVRVGRLVHNPLPWIRLVWCSGPHGRRAHWTRLAPMSPATPPIRRLPRRAR